MKNYSLLLAILAVVIVIESCGSGKNELVDDVLSTETTPVDFEFSGYSYSYGSKNILFDYVGNNLVESDTIDNNSCTLNLRQGNHKLIWINGLWPTNSKWNEEWGKETESGIYFNPTTKTLSNYYADGHTDHAIVYCEKDIEVSPYLLPVQKIGYKHLTCELDIEVTDNARLFTTQTEPKGRLTGIPSVKSISITGNEYSLNDVRLLVDSIRRYESYYPRIFMLCPAGGLDDIQPVAEITDKNGNLIPVTTIPKFSLRRGYTTTLRGPLLSGSTSDWTVTMKPYKD